MILKPTTPEEVSDIVRAHRALRPVAGRSKPALSMACAEATMVDVSALSGVIEYQPEECTFTALAGTPVSEIDRSLAQQRQYLPFDPPFSVRGATLGGTVASGLSGPLRYRYGGVRDFLLGARFVDGEGQIVRSGGKVVKNAAGFYLHHLLIGSLGRLGVLLDLTFKVFPLPEAMTTVVASYPTLAEALAALDGLRRSSFEPAAIDVLPPGTLYTRLAGIAETLPKRAEALERYLNVDTERLNGLEEETFWRDARQLAWVAPDAALVKIPVTPARMTALDEALATDGVARRYSGGGEVAWIAWPGPLATLDTLLDTLQLSGLLVIDAAGATRPRLDPRMGVRPGEPFLARARQALDPNGRFTARS
ncbi:MAG: FAD-binding protein [Luteitalea sp.]|nr:FAD-binding protein [Luteitalea sp.]